MQRLSRSFRPVAFLCLGCLALLSSCGSPLLRKGDRYADDGQWDLAVAVYREALKKDAFNADIQARLDEARVHAAAAHYSDGRQALADHRLVDALREFKHERTWGQLLTLHLMSHEPF